MGGFPGPISPEEAARISAYWNPSEGMSSAATPPPATPPSPPGLPADGGASYFGPPPPPVAETPAPFGPPPPPAGPAPLPEPPGALSSPMATQAPPPAPIMSGGGPIRSPEKFEREMPTAAVFGPPVAPQGYASLHPRTPGKANPDPYGVKAAERKLLGSFDKQEAGVEAQAGAEGERSVVRADALADLARQQREDAAIQMAERTKADEVFSQHMAETQRQLDEVRQQKIDPDRLMRKDGMGFQAVVGGLLGGLYQGLNHMEKNPFIEQLNHQIDRDIAVQEKQLASAREGVADRMNMLGQQRALYKDSELAKLQARNLAYESVKGSIEAESAKYDDPIIQARATQATAGINREQAGLQKQIADRAQAQAAAAAAHAAALAKAAHDQVNHTYAETFDKVLAAGGTPAQAEAEARRMVHVIHLGGAPARPEHEGPFGKHGKEQREAVQHVGDKLGEIDKQGMATDLEGLHKYLIDPKTGQVDKTRSIPGVGRLADVRESVAPPIGKGGALDVAGLAGPGGWALRGGSAWAVGLDPEERQNKNAYERSFLAFKNIKTGSASSEAEHERLVHAWEGAKTTEEVAAAVDQSFQFLQRHKNAIRAEDPAATAEYEANLRDLTAADRAGSVKREKP